MSPDLRFDPCGGHFWEKFFHFGKISRFVFHLQLFVIRLVCGYARLKTMPSTFPEHQKNPKKTYAWLRKLNMKIRKVFSREKICPPYIEDRLRRRRSMQKKHAKKHILRFCIFRGEDMESSFRAMLHYWNWFPWRSGGVCREFILGTDLDSWGTCGSRAATREAGWCLDGRSERSFVALQVLENAEIAFIAILKKPNIPIATSMRRRQTPYYYCALRHRAIALCQAIRKQSTRASRKSILATEHSSEWWFQRIWKNRKIGKNDFVASIFFDSFSRSLFSPAEYIFSNFFFTFLSHAHVFFYFFWFSGKELGTVFKRA